jgi:DNA (cytosine-5)-methyltransferase 1
MAFTFVDLFAGIGGFHAAMTALGGNCVYASEIDPLAAKVYEANWGLKPAGDLTLDANDTTMLVPDHDVLLAGFPCQPFSKSGKQRGMEEARGTLFWNIAKIIEARRPRVVLLENVRNLVGPRHRHEWDVIIATLRSLSYRVSETPLIVSPHRIAPKFGGSPQVRERVFIAATYDPNFSTADSGNVQVPDMESVTRDWTSSSWDLAKDLPLDKALISETSTALSQQETLWIDAWNDFVVRFRTQEPEYRLPGFPIWVDSWVAEGALFIPDETPVWKANFLKKNSAFYVENKKLLDAWLSDWNNLDGFPASRRKLEWQAQDSKDLWSTVLHFRPSGIRAKKPTYLPALVAITQTSVVGPLRRKINTREAARLQGFPDWFSFAGQPAAASYKQLGNAVNVGAVYAVMRALVTRDRDLLEDLPDLRDAILSAESTPMLSAPINDTKTKRNRSAAA